ncbi:MAG: SEL1-like repeat protein [Phycisphaerales bacterium]|nr:SEL1-like repeat protein [Phycisphaerales bacterium]
MVNLGRMYAEGKAVAQDYGEAVKWYRKAADSGDARGNVQSGR